MPVITITVGDHPALTELLTSVADSVARALELSDGDVIATSVPASTFVASGGAILTGWPVVSIHGSDRGEAASRAARAAAAGAVADWASAHSIEFEGVWTEWVPPHPLP
ncbi:hypothetical protein [Leifsonia sp. Leaf264]|uniref:hypothetical protein n=1 Tax=Leifsonia sp. Leaf264 TaxID=1736314 RepID=UPI0006F224A7|nr:hypothetical protein [Leifsonia sp. Leaf264]KQO96996.1 hypothetical protein ASF30_18255 [Leifsonia sp. Leaf264]